MIRFAIATVEVTDIWILMVIATPKELNVFNSIIQILSYFGVRVTENTMYKVLSYPAWEILATKYFRRESWNVANQPVNF